MFWHANEQSRASEERLRMQLSEGQSSVRARLEETDRIKPVDIASPELRKVAGRHWPVAAGDIEEGLGG